MAGAPRTLTHCESHIIAARFGRVPVNIAATILRTGWEQWTTTQTERASTAGLASTATLPSSAARPSTSMVVNPTACKRLFSLGSVPHTDGAVFQESEGSCRLT